MSKVILVEYKKVKNRKKERIISKKKRDVIILIKPLVKTFYRLKKRQECCKNTCEALVILNKGGLPLIRLGNQFAVEDILEGSFLTVATILSKACFETELSQIITSDNQIFIRRSENFLGYLVLKGTNKTGIEIANAELSQLLNHLESEFCTKDTTFIQPSQLEPILAQYANFVAKAY